MLFAIISARETLVPLQTFINQYYNIDCRFCKGGGGIRQKISS